MVISVIGETDVRPFIYTLMKICQGLGDVLVVTNDRRYMRFIEYEGERSDEFVSGHFQNTTIIITDGTPDEAQVAVGYDSDDYEFIIYVNKLDADSDLMLYVQGMEMSEWEEEVLEYLEEGTDYQIIHFGFGKNKIPMTSKMFMNCEVMESKKVLIQIDPNVTKVLCGIMSKELNIPANTLAKAVAK